MNIQTEPIITATEGDLSFRVGRMLCTFVYKGQDKFVFRTEELVTLQLMIAAIRIEQEAFVNRKKPIDKHPQS